MQEKVFKIDRSKLTVFVERTFGITRIAFGIWAFVIFLMSVYVSYKFGYYWIAIAGLGLAIILYNVILFLAKKLGRFNAGRIKVGLGEEGVYSFRGGQPYIIIPWSALAFKVEANNCITVYNNTKTGLQQKIRGNSLLIPAEIEERDKLLLILKEMSANSFNG